MTSSPLRRLIPLTPPVSRPIGLACFSLNRIACPIRETMRMSSSPVECCTETSSSSSHLDRDDPVGLQRRVVRGELGLLDDSPLRREREVLRLGELPRLDDGAHLLVLTERKQVLDRASFRLA